MIEVSNTSNKKRIECEGSNFNNPKSTKRSRKMVENDTLQIVNNNSSLAESATLISQLPSLVDTIKLLHLSSSDEHNGINLMSILTDHYFNGVTANDSKYKLFNRIRDSIISERSKTAAKQNLTGRVETELNYSCYMADLKFLISNVYKIEESFNLKFDWKTNTDILKKTQQRTQFVAEFAKHFSYKYID